MSELYKKMARRYPEKLPRPFDEIYKRVGYDGIDIFIQFFGGNNTYIPRHKSLFSECIRQEILSSYNGKNRRELCRRFNISNRTFTRYITDGEPVLDVNTEA